MYYYVWGYTYTKKTCMFPGSIEKRIYTEDRSWDYAFSNMLG